MRKEDQLNILLAVCVSYLDNCSRAARKLAHFDVTFPKYYQLMLPYIIMHCTTPVHCENGTTATDKPVPCQSFAVVLCLLFMML